MTFEDILFSLSKFHLSFLETLPRGHTRYNRLIVSTNHRPQYREQIQAKPLFPDFHITEIFVPFQGSRLDPRQGTRSYASTPLQLVFVRSTRAFTNPGSKAEQHGFASRETKRGACYPRFVVRRDSSKFFLRSNDLDKLKSITR